MSKRLGLEGSVAAAEAARMADVDVVAAYPITPQTHIIERLAEMVANGELHAVYIPVESEHSAMCACSGAASVGARTFTATSGQGFMLMHEPLYWVAAVRQPVVMAVANRAVGPPMNIWGDHSDAMTARDTGWIQIFASNNQEIFDLVLSGFRIAEDPEILLPVMVHLDGFTLSHMIEPVVLPEQEEVDKFLPKNRNPYVLRPDSPITYGTICQPDLYSEAKRAQDVVVREAKTSIVRIWKEFGDQFGRYYSPVERYRTEDATTLLVAMGSYSETAKTAVDRKREEGVAAGLLTLRLWRPFPFEELYEAAKNAEIIIVLDRSISHGGPGGPVSSEIKSALFGVKKDVTVVGFVGGLSGRSISVEEFQSVIDKGIESATSGSARIYETIGIRGDSR
jgi:pyruvate ferredoxin oxidoreductase alpha subunit